MTDIRRPTLDETTWEREEIPAPPHPTSTAETHRHDCSHTSNVNNGSNNSQGRAPNECAMKGCKRVESAKPADKSLTSKWTTRGAPPPKVQPAPKSSSNRTSTGKATGK